MDVGKGAPDRIGAGHAGDDEDGDPGDSHRHRGHAERPPVAPALQSRGG
jgi:hypothetical protein